MPTIRLGWTTTMRSAVAGLGSGPTAMSRRSATLPHNPIQAETNFFASVFAQSTFSGPSVFRVLAVPYLMSRSGVV